MFREFLLLSAKSHPVEFIGRTEAWLTRLTIPPPCFWTTGRVYAHDSQHVFIMYSGSITLLVSTESRTNVKASLEDIMAATVSHRTVGWAFRVIFVDAYMFGLCFANCGFVYAYL